MAPAAGPIGALDVTTPIRIDGEAPRAAPREPVVVQSDPATPIDYVEINERVLQFQDEAGFRLSVSAVAADGELAAVTPEGAIVLSRGDHVAVTGKGFAPRSDAVVWMFSTPRRLGVIRVRADGAFDERLRIAADVEIGSHTIQVNGLTATGALRSLGLAVVVRVSAPVAAPVASSPAQVRTPAPASSPDTSLPLAFVALAVLVAFGAGLLVPWRRGRGGP